MLPVQKPDPTTYMTLEDIQARKKELLTQLNKDSEQFSAKWHYLFAPKANRTKTELVGSIITNSITAIDTFLLVRKLLNNYGGLFGLKRKKNS